MGTVNIAQKFALRRFISSGLACAIAATLCVNQSATAEETENRSAWQTRVFIADQCPVTPKKDQVAPFLVAILAALIPKAIDFGFSFANSTLQEKKKEDAAKNDERSADALGVAKAFYALIEDKETKKPGPALLLKNACVIVIRGNFSPKKKDHPKDCEQFRHKEFQASEACRWLHEQGIYPSENVTEKGIGIYLESKFVVSDDNTSFRLQPLYFAYDEPIKRVGSGADGKPVPYDIVYTFTFEAGSTGQAVTPFGMAVLPFLSISPLAVYNVSLLHGQTSAWSPLPPASEAQQAELKRAQSLYDNAKTLPKTIESTNEQISKAEVKVAARLNELLNFVSVPTEFHDLQPAEPSRTMDVFRDGQARADQLLASDLFDDRIVTFKLDTTPETAPGLTDDSKQKAERQLKHIRVLRAIESQRAKVNELKAMSDNGLALRSALEKAMSDQNENKLSLANWKAGAAKASYIFTPINIKVNLKEKSYAPSNLLLLTAADAFSASKQDISNIIAQNIIQSTGLQTKDQKVTVLAEQAQFRIAAITALNNAQDAQAELAALPPDASDLAKRQKVLALQTAKINANIAYVKAGLAPPYSDAFGGDFQ